jgi:hypothetical protein
VANTHATDAAVLFVDAPLVVLNADKQRLCEKQVGQRYGRWKVSANSTNLASPRLAGVRFKRELEVCGWIYADGIAGPPRGGRVVSECYPYTAIVGADELGYGSERPLYKRKPKGLSVAAWRPVRAGACDVLIQRVADLRNAFTAARSPVGRRDARCSASTTYSSTTGVSARPSSHWRDPRSAQTRS